MKVTIPNDHPIFESAKVGDVVTITARVTEKNDEAATADVEKCVLAEPPKVTSRKGMSHVEYLKAQRQKAA